MATANVIFKRLQSINNLILRGVSTEVTHILGRDQLPDLTFCLINIKPEHLDSGKNFATLKIKEGRNLKEGHCDVCMVCFNSEEQRKEHMLGLKHAKKMRLKYFNFEKHYCKCCGIYWNSDKQRDQHLSSEKHRMNVEDGTEVQQNDSVLETPKSSRTDLEFCKYCMVYYVSERVKRTHLNGQKHKKRVEKAVNKNGKK